MSLEIPDSFDFRIDLGLDIDGIPTSYSVRADLSPIDLNLSPIALNLGPIRVEPVDLSLRLKEVPSVRAHFPVDYRVGLTLLGSELLCLRFCGQSQVITEPYVANPCEARFAAPGMAGAAAGPSLAELDRIVDQRGDRG